MGSIKDLVKTSDRLKQIEFWGTSTLFAFGIFYFVSTGLEDSSTIQQTKFRPLFEQAGVKYDYYENYFIPQLIRLVVGFAAFLYLNFINVPRLLRNEDPLWNALRGLLLFFFIGFMFGATNVLLREYVYSIQTIEVTLLELYGSGFLLAGFWYVVFGFYTILRFATMYMLDKAVQKNTDNNFIRKEGVVAFLIWAAILSLMLVTDTVTLFTLVWIVVIPPAIALYLFSFYQLIPESFSKPHPFRSYFSKVTLILAALFLPVAAFVWVLLQDGPPSVTTSILNSIFQLFVTAPVTWWLFRKKSTGNDEITTLKRELGQSTANFDFLRSQINPHFLFNALNTLYGTALQEGSERTSEGIQKLGDMMRFMLQENMQEKIPLTREIEYLENYITLQKLRTDTNPDIKIETNISNEHGHALQISPMLLIPFIENAFKHGISFRETSYINISLKCVDTTLYYDVHNSKHQRHHKDPEKNNTGIGLNNVQQRLQLSYPGKHEMKVTETEKNFSIYLSLQLT